MLPLATIHLHSFLLAQPHHPYSDAAGTASPSVQAMLLAPPHHLYSMLLAQPQAVTIPAGIASATPIAVPAGTASGTNHHLILLA